MQRNVLSYKPYYNRRVRKNCEITIDVPKQTVININCFDRELLKLMYFTKMYVNVFGFKYFHNKIFSIFKFFSFCFLYHQCFMMGLSFQL